MRYAFVLPGLRSPAAFLLIIAALFLFVPRGAQAVPPVAQCINFNAPAPLEICAQDDGTPGVWVDQPNGRTRQYYGDYSWGSVILLGGTDTAKRYGTSYFSDATHVTGVSNATTGTGTASDPYVITTVTSLGATGVQLTQRLTYVNGDRSFRKNWSLTNNGSSTFNDVRFMHGGDTYFGGEDAAKSWYDPTTQMVYVTNAAFTNSGYMGFYPNPGTPAAHYYGGAYGTGRSQALAGQLSDTADFHHLDAGYDLQWNRSTLAPGETWTIEAFEYWSPPGSLQVFAPAQSYVSPGVTVRKSFKVQNLDETNSASVNLVVAGGTNSWSVSLVGNSTRTLAASEVTTVDVDVVVPGGASAGTAEDISLTATAGSSTSTASARLTAFVPEYTITPASLSFGSVAVGQTNDLTITMTNGASASPATVGGVIAPASPFTVTSDGCSGHTLATGQACSIVVRMAPGSAGSFNGTLTVPVVAPVIASHVVSLSGSSANNHTVTATAGAGGTISPASVSVVDGQPTSFTVTPNAGYTVASVSGCSGTLSGTTYTVAAVTSECAISATFTNSPPQFEKPQLDALIINSSSLFSVLPTDIAPRAHDNTGAELDVTLVDAPERFGPGEYTLTWRTEDSRGVQSTVQQVLRIWPTVSFGPDVTIGGTKGDYGYFRVSLNGRSPVYPFTVHYHVEGDVAGSDLQDGDVVFQAGELVKDVGFAMTGSLPTGTPDQHVKVSFDGDVNRGSSKPLTVTISATNRPATVRFAPLPGGGQQPVVARDGGPVTLNLDIIDPNAGDTHKVEWQAPSGAVFTIDGDSLVLQPGSLPVGVHRFQVIVTDNGSPPQVTRSFIDVVVLPTAPVLPAGATALLPSGLPNLPDYAPEASNILPERERELHHFIMESDAGTQISLGAYAQSRSVYQTELASGASSPAELPADATRNVGGVFDFVVGGLPRVGDPVSVVIPQRVVIPAKPIYRKFSTATRKWQTFVEDNSGNQLASAPGNAGFCPPPASDQYRAGLNAGDWCARVTIVDGGPNDDDGQANGSVSDPGGVGSLEEVVVTGKSKGGGGALDVLTLFVGLLVVGARLLGRRRLRAGVVCALGLVGVQTANAADVGGWFAGGEFGAASSNGEAGQLTEALQARGHDVTATVDEQTHSAWRVYGGYEWSKYVAAEVGYLDLGDVRTTFTGSVPDLQQLLEDANDIHPMTADGFDFALVGRYALSERWSVHARAGVFAWKARTRTMDQSGQSVSRSDSGEDLLFGVGAGFDVLPQWRLTGDWSRYEVGESHEGFTRIGLTYLFR